MRQLRLVAVSEDGTHLILADGDHEQLALQVDERLHAAIRGDRARLGQLEIQLESHLRPRDIQARIRSGETVESVAAVAGMPLEKVRRFASPVLAEREHIAQRARQATVRRTGDSPLRTLDAVGAEYVEARGADPESITWDAWRREDGRWQVRFAWPAETGEATALFSFDPSGRSVVPEDDAARVAAGDIPPEPEPEPEVVPGPARLSVVPIARDDADDDEPVDTADPSPSGLFGVAGAPVTASPVEALIRHTESSTEPDTDDPTTDAEPGEDHLGASARRSRRNRYGRTDRRRREPDAWEQPAEDDEPTSDRLRLSDIAAHVEVEQPDPAAEAPPAGPDTATSEDPESTPEPEPAEPVTAKPATGSARSRRPSVPSWDEIMFGRRKTD